MGERERIRTSLLSTEASLLSPWALARPSLLLLLWTGSRLAQKACSSEGGKTGRPPAGLTAVLSMGMPRAEPPPPGPSLGPAAVDSLCFKLPACPKPSPLYRWAGLVFCSLINPKHPRQCLAYGGHYVSSCCTEVQLQQDIPIGACPESLRGLPSKELNLLVWSGSPKLTGTLEQKLLPFLTRTRAAHASPVPVLCWMAGLCPSTKPRG